MATIGRGFAMVEPFGVKVSGFFAWVFWIFLHIFWLIGFRNRVAVMTEWAWAYVTFQRRVRLITGEKLWPSSESENSELNPGSHLNGRTPHGRRTATMVGRDDMARGPRDAAQGRAGARGVGANALLHEAPHGFDRIEVMASRAAGASASPRVFR